jgi:four helix bundle protein
MTKTLNLFALTIIELYKHLANSKEYVISRQILKSGTSIGANVEEALAGQSRPDFLSKMSIASKEARETNYWLRLLQDGKIIDQQHIEKPMMESEEIIRMLTAIVKTTAKEPKLKTKN